MAFYFLNPWLWLGALAALAPVWLHLRRKRERNLIRFSAVRFLEDQPRARTSPLQFENILLLLLRILAVLLLVAAFAWPIVRRANSGAVKQSLVYILDNSLSHQANDGFKKDRDRVIRALGQTGTEVQIGIIELTATPRVVCGFKEERGVAQRKVAELQPSYQRGSYLAAFRQANSLLQTGLGQRKRIVLLGDSQENQWTENLNAPPFLREVQIEVPKPAATSLPNLWVSDLNAQRVFLGQHSAVNCTVRVGHLGPAGSAKVVLQINDRAVFSRTIDLVNQPESILLQAQSEADPETWLRIEASVEGTPDSLPLDNQAFCSVPPVVEGKLALLAQSPYLRVALSPEVMRGRWSTRVLEAGHLTAETQTAQPADVLCLESSFLQDAAGRELVKRYLGEGRGVFLLVNRLSPAIDGYLHELGFEAEGLATPDSPDSDHFQFVSFNHSIFRPFESPDFGNLMNIQLHSYARLRATGARPLIFSTSGQGLFFERAGSAGKLLVCAFGLDREQTSWPVDPTFIPFIDLALQAARPPDLTGNNFQPGEPAVIQLPASVPAHEIVLRGDGREAARATVVHGRAQVRLPDKPGLYEMTSDGDAQVRRIFSVNSAPKESELAFLQSPEALKHWCISDNRPAQIAEPPQVGLGFTATLQQRLWWWMLLAGLLALALETAVTETKGESVES